MPQQITISDETWERLKALAEPLTDTADDVISRLLDAGGEQDSVSGNQHSGEPGNPPLDAEDRITDYMLRSTRRHRGVITSERSDYGRIPRGLRLEVEAFRRPILSVLESLGGRGRPIQVLPLVEDQLKSRLNAIDYESLPTGGPRWEKTAHWARYALVEDGYIDGSDHGWWAITRKGRSALKSGSV